MFWSGKKTIKCLQEVDFFLRTSPILNFTLIGAPPYLEWHRHIGTYLWSWKWFLEWILLVHMTSKYSASWPFGQTHSAPIVCKSQFTFWTANFKLVKVDSHWLRRGGIIFDKVQRFLVKWLAQAQSFHFASAYLKPTPGFPSRGLMIFTLFSPIGSFSCAICTSIGVAFVLEIPRVEMSKIGLSALTSCAVDHSDPCGANSHQSRLFCGGQHSGLWPELFDVRFGLPRISQFFKAVFEKLANSIKLESLVLVNTRIHRPNVNIAFQMLAPWDRIIHQWRQMHVLAGKNARYIKMSKLVPSRSNRSKKLI